MPRYNGAVRLSAMTDDSQNQSRKLEAEPIPVNGNGGTLADGLAPTVDAAISGNGSKPSPKVEVETKKLGEAAAKKSDEDPVGKVYDSVLIRRLGHYLKPTGCRR